MLRRLAIACFILAVVVPPAAAQVNTLEADNPREDARLRLGPFYLTPAVQLTELGVDTNVFNQAGERESDFTLTVTPSATVWLPIARRGLIKATAASDLVWYRKFDSERSIDPTITVRGEAYLRRITLFAENIFTHSRQRPNFEIDVRSRRTENRFMGGVDVRLTPKFSLEVNGTKASTDFDGDTLFLGTRLEEVLDRGTTGFGAVARFRPTVLTTVALRAERFEDRFPLSPERGTDNMRVMPGVEFGERALINGRAYIGVRQLSPVDETLLPGFTGLVSDLGLTYTVLGATTIGVTHTRDIRYSFEPTQPYFVDTGIGGDARRALGPRFDVIVSAVRHTYSYRDLLLQTFAPIENRVDTIWNYGGNVGYRFGRDGRIGLGVTYWKRASTTRPGREYDGLRIGTTASYGF